MTEKTTPNHERPCYRQGCPNTRSTRSPMASLCDEHYREQTWQNNLMTDVLAQKDDGHDVYMIFPRGQ